MTIYNLGSINADVFYRLPHLVEPGETLAATSVYQGLGGKGANMSVAAARAGAKVVHIGAVGLDGDWAIKRLAEYGIDTQFIAMSEAKTGHAIIMVDSAGENAIVLHPGANHGLLDTDIAAAIGAAKSNDTLLLQNETNGQVHAARLAASLGLRVAYAAAPFDANAVQSVLPYLDFLIFNEIEAEQLLVETSLTPSALGVADVIVTLGPNGCKYFNNQAGTVQQFPAPKVTPIDTTGAGDTFTGYVLAAIDSGQSVEAAINIAAKAAAIMVTREGTADVIPMLAEVIAM
ncbi:MAG: ribokinase [Paracoccaceae bacterium]|jgi:ribokinase|nr:ribokinase [Paracoccaceae bacterium]